MKLSEYVCPARDCSCVYTNKFNLKRHIEAFHSDSRRFECPHCQKKLSSTQNLKDHLFIHTGGKPYACQAPGCGAKFRQGSQLSAHKRIHVAIKKLSRGPEVARLSVRAS